MGFCKPGDPCFDALGGFSLQRILDYQKEGRAKAEACGIDTSSLDFCTQINNCITGSTIHTSLTACTIWTDMIVPCDTGTTINGLLQVTGTLTAQTDTYLLGKALVDGKVGIGTRTPDYELDVEGDIGLNEYIYHNDDNDTYIKFSLDEINIVAGGKSFIKMTEAATDKIVINNGGTDVDLQVKGDNDANLIRTDAANDWIGIGTSSPTQKLTVEGSVAVSNAAHLDMVVPYSTGTTLDGLLQVTGAISAQTDTYVHGHIYSGTTNLLDIFCAKPCGSGGGGGVGLNDGYWSANTAGGISNSGGTRVGIGTTTPSSIFEVHEHLKFPAVNDVYMGRLSAVNWEATSHSNTAVGALTMGSSTLNGAIVNTAMGLGALGFITTGDYNTALGGQAHQGITTGIGNVSVGYLSQFTNSTNNNNTAVGMDTMRYTVNFGIGADMGDSYNTAIGHSSQYYSISSMFNTSVGAKTIGNGTVSVGSTGNTAVGYEAMKNSQQGSFNTAVGYQAGDSITTGKFNITIGNTADVGVATGNYQLNIGNIIYGRDPYDNDAISQIGINTNQPNRTLTVVGSISGTSNLDVGETLTVTGATRLHSSLRMTNGQYFYPDDGNNSTFILGQNDDLYIAADDDLFLAPDDDLQIWVGASAYAQFDGGTTSLNVGVGGTPTARIQSSGALDASNSIKKIDGEDECTRLTNFYHGLSNTAEGASVFISEEQEGSTGNFYLYSGPSAGGETPALNMDLILGAYQSRAACPREMIRLDGSSLLVGINNATPTRQLDVTGGIKGTTVEAGTISATTEFRIHTGNPAGGATVSPNIYWFGNCDAQSFGPASDGSFPSTNTTDVSWSETHNSHAGVYSFSAEELTIKRAGLYKITYNVTLEGGADGTTSNRTGGGIALLRKPSGGSYAVVDGTESYVYCRIASIERNTGTVTVIYNVTANDVFKVVFIRTGAQSATSKLGTITAGTAWTVEAVT